ncbi:tRNA-modifying protein YgfZ [Gammaproteobacteria bacterium]
MDSQWKNFLMTEGAEFKDEIVIHFGNPDQERAIVVNGNTMADLSHKGLIKVEGSDAITFLQGQMTCDIHDAESGLSKLGAWCNAKGRVRITFRVFQLGEGFYLELPNECVEETIKQLRKYILRSKVLLRDASQDWIRLGCSGPSIEDGLRQIFPTLPGVPDKMTHEGTFTIIRLRGIHPRFEIFGKNDALTKLWNTLKVRTATIGAETWSILEILSGVPEITRATTESFVPHMLNLPEIGAVSFSKGCYTGQEVVARMQYLGKSKRHLYLARIAGGEPPQPGDSLWIPSEDREQHPGTIINCAPSPEGGFLILAVIAASDVRKGEIRLHAATGPLLEFHPLPYPLLEE